MSPKLQKFKDAIEGEIPSVKIAVSAPYFLHGVWIIDLTVERYTLIVQFRDDIFGLGTANDTWETIADETFVDMDLAITRAIELLSKKQHTHSSRSF